MAARLTPSSAARRLARGDALTSAAAEPSLSLLWSARAGSGAGSEGAASSAGFGVSSFDAAFGASCFGASLAGSFGAGLAAGASPAVPIRAMGAPIFAGTPCSTMMSSTPSASDSRSNVALSDSTSAITSPFLTGSPLFFFHSTIVPSSIVSESFGMLISAIERLPADHLSRQLLDILAGRDRRLLEGQAVGHRHLRAAQPSDGGVQVVEASLLHARGDLGGGAVRRPALLDPQPARAAPNRPDRRRPPAWADGTE